MAEQHGVQMAAPPAASRLPGGAPALARLRQSSAMIIAPDSDFARRMVAVGIDQASIPMLLVQPDGVVVHVNPAAQEMLSSGRILNITSGRLATKRKLETQALEQLVAQAARPFDATEKPHMIGLKDRADHVVMVVSARTVKITDDKILVCVRVADLNHRPQANRNLLAEIFSLTRMEARVAEMVLNGNPTAEISTDLGISAETVRSHIKAVLRKFNVGTQAQMVGHALHALLAVDGLSPSNRRM